MKTPAFLCLTVLGAALANVAFAAELPAFQAGYWSFSSTVTMPGANKPTVRSVNRCTNPAEDIRKKWETLAGHACKFSPIEHTGNRYSYSSTCDRGGISLWMKSVITVDSEAAYHAETESHTNKQASKENIVAHRVGACPIVGPNAAPAVGKRTPSTSRNDPVPLGNHAAAGGLGEAH